MKERCAEFPTIAARDKRLGATLLVLLAYRTIFNGNGFRLIVQAIRNLKIKGLRDIGGINAAIKELVRLGYLSRWQPPSQPRGRHFKMIERLTLPPAGQTGYRIVYKAWFDGSLSVNELAALIYIRAGNGRGRSIYARELAERFGWSRPTTAAVLDILIERGFISKRKERDKAGRIASITYVQEKPGNSGLDPLSNPPLSTSPLSKKPTADKRDTLRQEGNPLTKGEEGLRNSAESRRDCAPPPEANSSSEALSSRTLPSSPADDELFQHLAPGETASQEVFAAAPDDAALFERLRKATRGRYSSRLDIDDLRYIAAVLVEIKGFAADKALATVLDAIRIRVGRGIRLNSFTLISRRLFGELQRTGDVRALYLPSNRTVH